MYAPLLVLAALLFVSCANSSTGDGFPAQAPTGAETPLYNELNQIRANAGKEPFTRSTKLDALAASESARLAHNGSRKADATGLLARSGFSETVVLVGALKDRGPQTGSRFPSYWMQDDQQKDLFLSDWSELGVGTAKSTSGELVSVVIFGRMGGGSLMNPPSIQ